MKIQRSTVAHRVRTVLAGVWNHLRRDWLTARIALVGLAFGLLAWLEPPEIVVFAVSGGAVLAAMVWVWQYYGWDYCSCSVPRP